MKIAHRALKCFVFLTICGVLIFGAERILTPKWRFPNADSETDKFGTFYEMPDNTMDYLVVGASTTMFSVNPMQIYADTGITGYDLGTGRQNLTLSYYWTKEALKTQSPSVIFLDTTSLFGQETLDTDIMRSLSSMKFSRNKIDAVLDLQSDSQSSFQLLFPFIQFHVRWNSLTDDDWRTGPAPNYFLNGCVLSFNSLLNTVKDHFDFEYDTLTLSDGTVDVREAVVKLDDEEMAWFTKIAELCEEKGITLVPYLSPTMLTTAQRKEATRSFLGELGLELLDLSGDEWISIDWTKDTYDGGFHTNYWGCAKASAFLADYLSDLGLKDHRGEEGYGIWDEQLEQYREYERASLYDPRQTAYNYLSEVNAIKNDSIVILTAMDDAAGAWNDTLEAQVHELGVKSSFYGQIQNSFVAIIDEGENKFEKWDDRRIAVNVPNYPINDSVSCDLSVSSAGLVCGNVSEVLINGGANLAVNSRGLNIVVIDKTSAQVISSVAVDTHDPALPLTEMTLQNGLAGTWRTIVENFQLIENGIYCLIPVSNGECAVEAAGMDEDANITLGERSGDDRQKFEIQNAENGLFTIRVLGSNKYLAIEDMGSTPGSNVVQQTYTGLANQLWFAAKNEDGSYSFSSLYNGQCLDVTGGVISTGTNIQTWIENYATPQQFYLVKE